MLFIFRFGAVWVVEKQKKLLKGKNGASCAAVSEAVNPVRRHDGPQRGGVSGMLRVSHASATCRDRAAVAFPNMHRVAQRSIIGLFFPSRLPRVRPLSCKSSREERQ